MRPVVRGIVDEEFALWFAAESTGFGNPPPTVEQLAAELSVADVDRWLAAFDGTDIVGTAADYSFDMAMPGGGVIPVAGVTGVTVMPTHRRRGILTEMMRIQLDAVAARGEPMAILNASEAPIYHRFGYGVAQLYRTMRVRSHRVRFDRVTPERRLRMLTKADAHVVLPPIYDALLTSRAGMLSHSPQWWACVLGDSEGWKGGGDVFVVVAEPEGDDPGGFAIWTMKAKPGYLTMHLRDLVAATPETEIALWRCALEVDLVSEIVVENCPIDDQLRWWLSDMRAAHITEERDYLWVRILDVPRVLAARRYPVEDALVLDVRDAFRPQTAGTYRLVGGSDGATCTAIDEAADLTLDIAELGSLVLGGVSAAALAHAGRIESHTPDAVARAAALFAWPVAPHCITRF